MKRFLIGLILFVLLNWVLWYFDVAERLHRYHGGEHHWGRGER
jgi:uncharacterized protein YqhQ